MARSTDALVKLGDTDLTVADPRADIRGRKVVDRAGDDLGRVDALLIDQTERKVRFLEVASGGFLGMGERKILLPVDAVTRVEPDLVQVDTTRQQVVGAPAYDPTLAYDRAYYGDVYGYYGLSPYWTAGYAYPPYPIFPIGAAGAAAVATARNAPTTGSAAPVEEVTVYEAKPDAEVAGGRTVGRPIEGEPVAGRRTAGERAAASAGMTEAEAAADAAALEPLIPEAGSNAVLNQIYDGMRVVDAHGDDLGKVDFVKMGDPDAATLGADAPGPGFWGGLFGVAGEPDIPQPMRDRYLREGFVKIDGKGWIDTDRWVTPDQIAGVSGDTVTLRVDKDQLLSEP